MLRTLNFTLVVATLASGCGVGGGDQQGMMPPGGGSGSNPPPDPVAKCTAQLTLSGTFTASATLDPAGGCQPDGMWVVMATVADKGTCANVPLKASYTYTLSGSGRTSVLMYTKAAGEEFTGAVSATGTGGCEGSFDHVLPDGSNFDEINLHPELPIPTAGTTLTISGTGEYDLWSQHP
jgi:hypothetical protein